MLGLGLAQRIAQISADRLQDQRRLEVAAPEVVLGAALQPLGNRTQDYGVPEPETTKLATMPVEPSTSEICDRPRRGTVHPGAVLRAEEASMAQTVADILVETLA